MCKCRDCKFLERRLGVPFCALEDEDEPDDDMPPAVRDEDREHDCNSFKPTA